MSKVDAFAINEIQAKTLGTAIANVARHYDTGMSQKSLDMFNLAQCCVLIYGPMIGHVVSTGKAKRRTRQAPPQETAPEQPGAFTNDFAPTVVNLPGMFPQ